MQTEFITTDGGEELVVVTYSRREYDVLLARLGDEEAEDRMTALMAAEHQAEVAAGRAVLLPDWLVYGTLDGLSPLATIRRRRDLSVADLSHRTGMAFDRLVALEDGMEPASDEEVEALAAALDCEAAWLHP